MLCPSATMSNLADYRIGTVGRPLPGVEIRLDDDGELLIKGENVFIRILAHGRRNPGRLHSRRLFPIR